MVQALELYWHDKHEISMMSREMFAKLFNIISRARAGQVFSTKEPFGGLHDILVGNFHQFPAPVASGASLPLHILCNPSKDSTLDMLGRKLYEQFDVVVRLTTRVRVTDPVWVDLLRRARHGRMPRKRSENTPWVGFDQCRLSPHRLHSTSMERSSAGYPTAPRADEMEFYDSTIEDSRTGIGSHKVDIVLDERE